MGHGAVSHHDEQLLHGTAKEGPFVSLQAVLVSGHSRREVELSSLKQKSTRRLSGKLKRDIQHPTQPLSRSHSHSATQPLSRSHSATATATDAYADIATATTLFNITIEHVAIPKSRIFFSSAAKKAVQGFQAENAQSPGQFILIYERVRVQWLFGRSPEASEPSSQTFCRGE